MTAYSIEEQSLPENIRGFKLHPQRFALWMGIAVLCMTFAGLTSAYIVRSQAPNWLEFRIPMPFYWSAAVIMLSSVTMHFTVKAFKNDNLSAYRLLMASTVALGLGFVAMQVEGYRGLQDIGVYLNGNPSGSFIYAISLLHIAHVAMGILFLLYSFVKSLIVFRNPANFLIYQTDDDKKIRIELLATYWHFVDILWLYLLLFFILI